jgi:hypothetical protein
METCHCALHCSNLLFQVLSCLLSPNKMSVLIALSEEKSWHLDFHTGTQEIQFVQVIIPTNEEVSTGLLRIKLLTIR